MASGDLEPFFTGCGVSPFKTLKSECLAQYKKLDKKIDAGAGFVITQLGYDINKFNELIRYHNKKKCINTGDSFGISSQPKSSPGHESRQGARRLCA